MRCFLGIILSLLTACSSGMQAAPELTPVRLAEESAPITFARLVIRVPAGTEIGHHHSGLLKIKRAPYVWQSNLTIASDEFKVIASEVMQSYGYDVKGGDNLLFGVDESAKAEYQLGGTLTSILYDTYGSLAGNHSDARLHIEWQLYDAFQRRVVFEVATDGYAKLSGRSAAVAQEAFKAALRNLLADTAFVATVRRSPSDLWEGRIVSQPVVIVTQCPTIVRELPAELNDALDAVLVIRTGGGLGSGVVVSPDGYAVTAAHVVSGLESVVAKLHSGLEFTASVVRVDEAQDVALIKLPGRGHACLPAAGDSLPSIGSEVFAIGAPAGEEFAFSVTKGIVSAVRQFDRFSYIQTDASLNPGNSGGPILTPDGQVVGVVSWKIAAQGFEGMSFCVPMNALQERLTLEWR